MFVKIILFYALVIAFVIDIKSKFNCDKVAKAADAVLNYEVVKSGETSEDKFETIDVKSLANYESVASGEVAVVIVLSNVEVEF